MATTKKPVATVTASSPAPAKPAVVKKASTSAKKPAAPAKAAAVKKAAAPKAAKAKATKKVGPEERYKMIEVAAYFIAERDGFRSNSTDYWIKAEAEIAKLLK